MTQTSTRRPRPLTPAMRAILVQAAARPDGNAQMFTNTVSQADSLVARGYVERGSAWGGDYARITEAGRMIIE